MSKRKYLGCNLVSERAFAALFDVDLVTVRRWILRGCLAVDDRKKPYKIMIDAESTLFFLMRRKQREKFEEKWEHNHKEK